MGLIKCPECGKEISDMAQSCPNCGRPMQVCEQVNTPNQNPPSRFSIYYTTSFVKCQQISMES